MVPLDRIMTILAKPAPSTYASGGRVLQREYRLPTYRQGVAVLLCGEKLPIVIKNLSKMGCRIEYFKNVRLEGRMFITEPSIPLRCWGDVVWQEENASGVVFIGESGGL